MECVELLIVLLGLLLSSSAARAGIIFSNLGSGANVYGGGFWAVYGAGSVYGEGGLVTEAVG